MQKVAGPSAGDATMRAVFRTIRPYLIAVACSWLALIGAATFYSKEYSSSAWIWTAALPAFLLEALFYLGSVFESTRSWFASLLTFRLKATLLWLSSVLPYLIFSLGSGTFSRYAFYLVALLSGVLAFWHLFLPRRLPYDIGFLVIAAAPFLTKVFGRIYRSPDQHFHIDVLGHLMWIRLGLVALLVMREWDPGPVTLWPRKQEWRLGAMWFAIGIVPLAATALGLHEVRFAPLSGPWWRVGGIALGTFFGSLWVLTLGEELFFRGVVERAFLNTWRSQASAVVVSSLLFGGVHLWFHQFPNWQRALVATILGIPCGIAYLQSGSIRASMVTHSLAVLTWKMLFK